MVDQTGAYEDDLSPDELAFQRRYGPWDAWTPQQAKEVFDPTGLTWWIAGGWAIEAFTGEPRPHEDIDVSMWRKDVLSLVDVLDGSFHVWAAGPDGLCPLYDDRKTMPERADQVWLRQHALGPWLADCVLNRDRNGRWVSRRDPDFDAPLSEVTWEREGIRYYNPEIVLSFKAKLARPKDERDFDVTLPLLDDRARAFLADYLRRKEPAHPWQQRL